MLETRNSLGSKAINRLVGLVKATGATCIIVTAPCFHLAYQPVLDFGLRWRVTPTLIIFIAPLLAIQSEWVWLAIFAKVEYCVSKSEDELIRRAQCSAYLLTARWYLWGHMDFGSRRKMECLAFLEVIVTYRELGHSWSYDQIHTSPQIAQLAKGRTPSPSCLKFVTQNLEGVHWWRDLGCLMVASTFRSKVLLHLHALFFRLSPAVVFNQAWKSRVVW